MNETLTIPNGDKMITIQLTVKEAMALCGGVQFRPESKIALRAKRKMRKELERTMLPFNDRVAYHTLDA